MELLSSCCLSQGNKNGTNQPIIPAQSLHCSWNDALLKNGTFLVFWVTSASSGFSSLLCFVRSSIRVCVCLKIFHILYSCGFVFIMRQWKCLFAVVHWWTNMTFYSEKLILTIIIILHALYFSDIFDLYLKAQRITFLILLTFCKLCKQVFFIISSPPHSIQHHSWINKRTACCALIYPDSNYSQYKAKKPTHFPLQCQTFCCKFNSTT